MRSSSAPIAPIAPTSVIAAQPRRFALEGFRIVRPSTSVSQGAAHNPWSAQADPAQVAEIGANLQKRQGDLVKT